MRKNIKIIDLMLGDLVIKDKKPIRITELSSLSDEEYEAISLSEELLIFNSFLPNRRTFHNTYEKVEEGRNIIITITHQYRGDTIMFVEILSTESRLPIIKIELEYVHELQHAMKLAGIKKEFILQKNKN